MSQSNGFSIDSSMLELFKIELENHARVLESGLLGAAALGQGVKRGDAVVGVA